MLKSVRPILDSEKEYFFRLSQEVIAQGGGPQTFEFISKEAGQPFVKNIAKLLVAGSAAYQTCYRVPVHYDWPLIDVIMRHSYAAGVDREINAVNFPHRGDECVNLPMFLYKPGSKIGSHDVIGHLHVLGLRPATMVELAAFGSQFPDMQRNVRIAALGQLWRNPLNELACVGCLDMVGEGEDGKRCLQLRALKLKWAAHYAFLATPL